MQRVKAYILFDRLTKVKQRKIEKDSVISNLSAESSSISNLSSESCLMSNLSSEDFGTLVIVKANGTGGMRSDTQRHDTYLKKRGAEKYDGYKEIRHQCAIDTNTYRCMIPRKVMAAFVKCIVKLGYIREEEAQSLLGSTPEVVKDSSVISNLSSELSLFSNLSSGSCLMSNLSSETSLMPNLSSELSLMSNLSQEAMDWLTVETKKAKADYPTTNKARILLEAQGYLLEAQEQMQEVVASAQSTQAKQRWNDAKK